LQAALTQQMTGKMPCGCRYGPPTAGQCFIGPND
jgi:hypothetical protein